MEMSKQTQPRKWSLSVVIIPYKELVYFPFIHLELQKKQLHYYKVAPFPPLLPTQRLGGLKPIQDLKS
jgi:hypothetical protein